MNKFLIIPLSFFLLLCSCNNNSKPQKQIESVSLDSIVWNLDLSGWKENPYPPGFSAELSSRKQKRDYYMRSFKQGKLSVKNDTLFIRENDSLVRIGIIEKLTHDSLYISGLEGRQNIAPKFPDRYCKPFKFYNDELTMKPGRKFQTLYFSTSTCEGTCPSFDFKIDSAGTIFYFGGSFAQRGGAACGKLSEFFLKNLKSKLSKLSWSADSLTSLKVYDDQNVSLVLYSDNKKFVLNSASSALPIRFSELNDLFDEIYINEVPLLKACKDSVKVEGSKVLRLVKFIPPKAFP